MRQLGNALVVVVVCCAVALAGPKKAPKAGKADPKAQPAATQTQPDPKLQAEWIKVMADYTGANSKQQFALAAKHAKKAYEIQLKMYSAGSVEVERALQVLALAYMGAGDYVNSEKWFIEYTKAVEKRAGNTDELIDALQLFNNVYMSQQRYEDSEKVMQRMLAVAEKAHSKKSKQYAEVLEQLGSLYYARGIYTAAVHAHEEALQTLESIVGKNDQALLGPLENLGVVLIWSDQKAKAIPYFDRVVQIAESGKDMAFYTRQGAIFMAGSQLVLGGRKDLGAPYVKKAIAMSQAEVTRLEGTLAKEPNNIYQLAGLQGNIGYMYFALDEYPSAEAAYAKAAATYKKVKINGGTDYMLGYIKRVQGKYKEALALLESAKAEMEKSAPTAAVAMNANIVEALLDLKDYPRAEKLNAEYVQYMEKQNGKKSEFYAMAQMTTVRIYMSSGKLKQAEPILKDSLEIEERELAKALKIGTDADHAVYFGRHRYELDTALNFNLIFQPTSGSAARIALTTLLRRKGRILDAAAATLSNIRKNLSPDDQKILDELASARTQLAKLTVAGPQGSGDPAGYAKDVAALEDKIARLEGQIAKKSAAYRTVSTPIELATIQKAIPKDAKLIEIVNYQPYDPRKVDFAAMMAKKIKEERHYAAYIIGPSGDPVAVELGDAAPIEAMIEKFRKAVADPDNDQAAALGNELYKLTMGKILPKVGNTTNLLVAPDGALNVVPFSALVDDKKQFLIAKYTFTYLTSGRDLLRVSIKPKSQGGGVMFADPQFDGGKGTKADGKTRGTRSADLASLHWPQLPGTAAEADAVSKAYKQMKVYRGDAATEGTLKQIKSPRILHLATHGFFLPDEAPPPSDDGPPGMTMAGPKAPPPQYENPLLRSGLALAGANKLSSGNDDGLLTALEASGLDLEGTKLVVLSACETGVGKVTNGDGVYGLRRSLVIAGAESLVMSMWQVDDFATKELMTNLYKGLGEGKGRSAAMRDAQIKVLTNPKFAHPFYWAAFVPAGSTAPIKE